MSELIRIVLLSLITLGEMMMKNRIRDFFFSSRRRRIVATGVAGGVGVKFVSYVKSKMVAAKVLMMKLALGSIELQVAMVISVGLVWITRKVGSVCGRSCALMW